MVTSARLPLMLQFPRDNLFFELYSFQLNFELKYKQRKTAKINFKSSLAKNITILRKVLYTRNANDS